MDNHSPDQRGEPLMSSSTHTDHDNNFFARESSGFGASAAMQPLRSNNNSFVVSAPTVFGSTKPFENNNVEQFLMDGGSGGGGGGGGNHSSVLSPLQSSANSSFLPLTRTMPQPITASASSGVTKMPNPVPAPKPQRLVATSASSSAGPALNASGQVLTSSSQVGRVQQHRDPLASEVSATSSTATKPPSPHLASPHIASSSARSSGLSRETTQRGPDRTNSPENLDHLSPSSFRTSPVAGPGMEQDFPPMVPDRNRPQAHRGSAPIRNAADVEMPHIFSPTSNRVRDFTPASGTGSGHSGGSGVVHATGSVASRRVGSVRASARSGPVSSHPSRNSPTTAGGLGRPAWLNAAERVSICTSYTRPDQYDSVLPIDQSKYGQQQRQRAQNTLTVSRLQALEDMHRQSPVRNMSNNRLQSMDDLSYARDHRSPNSSPLPTSSEQSAWRRGRIRATTGGGSGRSSSPTTAGQRLSPKILTAMESNMRAPPLAPATAAPIYAVSERRSPVFSGIKNALNVLSPKPVAHGPGVLVASQTVGLTATASENFSNKGSVQTNTTTAHNWNKSMGNNPKAASTNTNSNSNNNNDVSKLQSFSVHSGMTGGGGGGFNSSSNTPRKPPPPPLARHTLEGGGGGKQSAALQAAMNTGGDEDGREERNLRTRNTNAIHAIPWDQRRQMPMSGFGTRFFSLLSSPRFWEKLDWAFRGAVLTILPTMILSLEPATAGLFPMSSSLAFNAFWISMPTFGSGLREFYIALKGFTMGLVVLCFIVGVAPGPSWLSLLLLFFFTLGCSFIAEETKKTTAYVLASTIMSYVKCPRKSTDASCAGNRVNFNYIGVYYEGLLCALAFGLAGFLVPFIRWSSHVTTHYLTALGNTLSIEVQGTCSSFWTASPLERELNVVRLRQLRMTANKCIEKINTALAECEYEPHTGKFLSQLKVRFKFCMAVHNILGSMSQVVELLGENPSLIDTPMCNAFGQQIAEELYILSSAMDSMILKIVDLHKVVTPVEILFFHQARERFQEALSAVREDVILNNESYETDESDVFLGFFMFSVDELCEVIANFEEDAKPRNNITHFLLFWYRDLKSVINACKNLYDSLINHRTVPRRLKEAIKLSLCMTIPSIFQVYAFSMNDMSAFAGASIIALIYNPTGSESFHYATGRLLGTVLGSTASYLIVQIANLRRWVLYICLTILSFIGCYVQAAPGFYALGNAIACSCISIVSQYQDQSAAMTRIQQNCFAILMYFAITSIIWPMRARKRVRMGLDVSLRCMREATARLLRNLDMPEDPNEVAADASALLKEMNRKVSAQFRYIPGAVEEPTLSSAEYPEESWRNIAEAENRIWSTLSLMRFAYNAFMTSNSSNGVELSVHWVVLHRIAPHAQDLADLVYSLADLYLLSISKATVVPTTHLSRIRLAMIEAHQAILETYIETISRKVAGEDCDDNDEYDDREDEEEDYSDGGSSGSAPAPATISNRRGDRGGQDGDGGDDDRNDNDNNNHNNNSNSHNDNNNNNNSKSTANENTTKGDKGTGKENKKTNDNDNDDGDEEKKKKKKTGYLGYNITEEEKQALRNYVSNQSFNNNASFLKNMMQGNKSFASPLSGVSGNKSFGGAGVLGNNKSFLALNNNNNKSFLGATNGKSFAATNSQFFSNNKSFLGGDKPSMAGSPPNGPAGANSGFASLAATAARSGATATAANAVSSSANPIALAAALGSTGDQSTRLMALTGNDAGLAAQLRKKHHVTPEREEAFKAQLKELKRMAKEEEENNKNNNNNNSSKPEQDTDPLDFDINRDINIKNSSFMNSSFIKNTSFIGNLFRMVTRKHKKKDGDDKDGDDDDSSHSDKNSQSASGGGDGDGSKKDDKLKKPHRDGVSDGTLENDSHTNTPRRSECTKSPASHQPDTAVPETAKREPAQDADSRHSNSMVHSSSEEEMIHIDPHDDVASYSTVSGGDHDDKDADAAAAAVQPPAAAFDGKRTETTEGGGDGGNLLPGSPTFAPDSNGTPLKNPLDSLNEVHGSGNFTVVTTTHAADAAGSPPPPAPSSRDKSKTTDSHDSSCSTVKKFISGNGSSNSQEETGDRALTQPVRTPLQAPPTDKPNKKRVALDDDLKKKKDPFAALKSADPSMANSPDGKASNKNLNFANDDLHSSSKKVHHTGGTHDDVDQLRRDLISGAGSHSSDNHPLSRGDDDDGDGNNPDETLRNLSFFDAERGEFVLTNHDIHSLEAFLFGTRALVVYINQLQKSLLEMQHQSDIAKNL